MKKLVSALVVSTLASSALALDSLPKEAGFSGFVGVGAAGGRVESNFLAEIVGIDLSDDLIYTLDSPNDTNIIVPAFDYNLGYTFDNNKTRVSLINAVEDALDFSNNTALAIRHDFDSVGNMELAGLAPSLTKVEVWENPYLTNQKRRSTEFYTTGVRFTWDKIFDSGFEFIVNARKVDIDEERSGQDIGLSAAEQKLLDREGDVARIEIGYMTKLGNGEHTLRPGIAYIDRDLDGEAMAQDGYELSVNYIYDAGNFKWLNRAVYQSLDGDKVNPLFNKTNDANEFLLATEVRYPEPFGWDKWTAVGGLQWGENDADIDFNESMILMVTGRIVRRF
jgi:hypothetical protein